MPITAYHDTKNNGLLSDNFDIVTGDEISNSLKNIFSYPFFIDLNYWIVDRTRCVEYDVSGEDIQRAIQIVSFAAKRKRDIYHAFVSPSDLTFGMSRMFQILADDHCFITEVFHTRAEADRWIEEKLSIDLSTADYKQL